MSLPEVERKSGGSATKVPTTNGLHSRTTGRVVQIVLVVTKTRSPLQQLQRSFLRSPTTHESTITPERTMKSFRFASSLLALTFAVTVTGHAQISDEPRAGAVETWSQFIGKQLSESLVSSNPEIKATAIRQIMYFARYAPTLDLTETVSPLLEMYKADKDEQYRVASVAALHAIGDERGMQQVRMGVERQSSRRVQVAALATLIDYYGPETFERDRNMDKLARELIVTAETL